MILEDIRQEVRLVLSSKANESREALHNEMRAIASRYKVTVAEVYVIYYTMRAEKGRTTL